MKIYDITQELFTCCVYPGDPSPERQVKLRIADGAMCNLTAFQMCAHNGTHVDAPYHFVNEGKTIDQVDMERWIGLAYVTAHEGAISAEDARQMLEKAGTLNPEAAKPVVNGILPEITHEMVGRPGAAAVSGHKHLTVLSPGFYKNPDRFIEFCFVNLVNGVDQLGAVTAQQLVHAISFLLSLEPLKAYHTR